MCTSISMRTAVTGAGIGTADWFPITQANVGYDHAASLRQEHAVLLDFVNPGLDVGARVAIELDIPSGKALVAQLEAAIAAAEQT